MVVISFENWGIHKVSLTSPMLSHHGIPSQRSVDTRLIFVVLYRPILDNDMNKSCVILIVLIPYQSLVLCYFDSRGTVLCNFDSSGRFRCRCHSLVPNQLISSIYHNGCRCRFCCRCHCLIPNQLISSIYHATIMVAVFVAVALDIAWYPTS